MKAKTGTVTLFMPEYKATSLRPAMPEARPVVPATIIAGFALHRSVNRDGTEESPARWTLTHVASGASVNNGQIVVSPTAKVLATPIAQSSQKKTK